MNEVEATTKVLALIVKLHLDGQQPWPPRARVSELTGVPLSMMDTVMEQLQATRQITVWTATTSSNINKPEPEITKRYIQPSQNALDVVREY